MSDPEETRLDPKGLSDRIDRLNEKLRRLAELCGELLDENREEDDAEP